MKRTIIVSFILVTLIMFGCKDNSVEPPPPVKYYPLIPLSVGNYWLYRGYDLNSDGTGGTPDLWKFGFIIQKLPQQPLKILDSTHLVMHECAENLSLLDDSKSATYGGNKLVYQNKNGLYYSGIIRNDTLAIIYNDLIFPYPAEKGKSVSGHVFYYSNSGNYLNVPDDAITQYTCISTDSLFTTPLGDFRCIVYKMAYADYPPLFRDEVYYFVKPELGIVSMVQMVYHYNLKKYSYIRKTLLTNYQIK